MNEQYTQAPHQSAGAGGRPSPNAALLIDFDNVTMAIRSNLGQELRNLLNSDITRGKVAVQRAYADWRRYPQYIVPLSEASIDLIFAPAYGSSKKNATDIRLAIDALELVFTRPEIGTFILLSGDSDFSSLVLKLKEYGKYVIGVGLQESSSDLLVQNCDEYYSYNSLSGLVSAEDTETRRHDPWDLVRRAIRRMEERDDVMRSDRLKQVMLEFDSTFDEKDLGFSKFNRFLSEASSRGLVRIRKIGDGQYEVAGTGEVNGDGASPAAEPDPAKERTSGRRGRGGKGSQEGSGPRGGRAVKEKAKGKKKDRSARDGDGRSSSRGRPEMPPEIEVASLKDAYDLLAEVVVDLAGPGDEGVRDSEVKREMLKRREHFDEGEFGFQKFSRFLRQAHDEGIVDLTTDADGNYHLLPASDAAGGGTVPERPAPERPAPAPERESGGAAEGSADGGEPESGGEGKGADATTGAGAEKSASAQPSRAETSASTQPSAADGEGGNGDGSGDGGKRRRRGLGRFRRGSRGRASGTRDSGTENALPGPADAGPVEEASSSPRDGDRASRGTGAESDPLEHMVQNYPGVGRKTAEKLVESFGESIFEVIDDRPERLRDVLPGHRVEAVLEARRAERERLEA